MKVGDDGYPKIGDEQNYYIYAGQNVDSYYIGGGDNKYFRATNVELFGLEFW